MDGLGFGHCLERRFGCDRVDAMCDPAGCYQEDRFAEFSQLVVPAVAFEPAFPRHEFLTEGIVCQCTRDGLAEMCVMVVHQEFVAGDLPALSSLGSRVAVGDVGLPAIEAGLGLGQFDTEFPGPFVIFESKAVLALVREGPVASDLAGLFQRRQACVVDEFLARGQDELEFRRGSDVDLGMELFDADLRDDEQVGEKRQSVEVDGRGSVIGATLEDADPTSVPGLDVMGAREEVLPGLFSAPESDRQRKELRRLGKLMLQRAVVDSLDVELDRGPV